MHNRNARKHQAINYFTCICQLRVFRAVKCNCTNLVHKYYNKSSAASSLTSSSVNLRNRWKETQNPMETISHYNFCWGTLLIVTEMFPVLLWIQTAIHSAKNVSSLVTNWILFVKPIFVSKSDTVWEPVYYGGRRLKCLSTAVKDTRNIVHT